MIDTLTIRCCWPLRGPDAGPHVRGLARHVAPGGKVRLTRSGHAIGLLECSLPKVLFGHNGRVLATEEELNAALERLREGMNRYAMVPPVHAWKPWRIDLAWNFDLPAQPLIVAFGAMKLPGVHRCTEFKGEGVSYRGAKSRFMVTFYDKSKAMRRPGSVLRAEVSLRGTKLRQKLPGEWWLLQKQWEAFRQVLGTLPPVNRPPRVKSFRDAACHLPMEAKEQLLVLLSTLPARTFRDHRRKLMAPVSGLPERFSWDSYLPVTPPDSAPVVEPLKRGNREPRKRVNKSASSPNPGSVHYALGGYPN